ncbi:hypothetical protein ACTXT7_006615 [Hymenolepis weldensis]
MEFFEHPALVIWFAVVPLREHLAFGLVVACLVQELMRFLFYLLISFSEAGLHKIADYEAREASCSNSTGEPNTSVRIVNSSDSMHGSIFNIRKLAFSSGLSFALMGGIFEYIYILYDVIGPATLFEGTNPGCFFIFAAGGRWPSRAHSHPMRTSPIVILDPAETVHTAIS